MADGAVDRPIVIVGQPRTGTTILYDLLAQDPANRAPLTWEVDQPVPPPETATYDTDPRIEEAEAVAAMPDLIIPGFTDFHPMGARLAQECVRMTGGEFRSMIFPTQYDVPDLRPVAAARGGHGAGLPVAPHLPPAPPEPATPANGGSSSRPPTCGASAPCSTSTPTPW